MKSELNFDQLFNSIHKSSTIVLVGFMGSGKTTFGKKLASKLNYNFIDTDREIEDLVGMSINEIFEKKGEEYFRTLERQLIKKLNIKNTVVATGGGMPCFYNNIERLNKIGVTVYLKYSVDELFDRLKDDKENRPLIKNNSDLELFEYIETSLKKREPFYLKSQTIF